MKLPETYRRACEHAVHGRYDEARADYEGLLEAATDPELEALVTNDLGVLAALEGDERRANDLFESALGTTAACRAAQANRRLLGGEHMAEHAEPIRIAVVSFLFNWPSTGGGIIHTVELVEFLRRAGYEVCLLHPVYSGWEVGRVDASCPVATRPLVFEEGDWNVATIKARFRRAVDEFAPDHVLVTDCWNFKPHLANALRGYPVFLRMQAQECLCPLNNLRLLPHGRGGFTQCPSTQLEDPNRCRECVAVNAGTSGGLHRAERALSGVGSEEYNGLLRRALDEAAGVLTLNPGASELFRPYARHVATVTWGMDPERLPPELAARPPRSAADGVKRLLFAGRVDEPIKGFAVLQEACAILRSRRRDFEVVATAEPLGRHNEFTRCVGWRSQQDLPGLYAECDVCVVPTIVQDGLSRTSVEAMGAGRAVVAGRIGGLPFTVTDGETGLLFEPGDPRDLAEKLERLLDEAELRRTMGAAGRRAFEERFLWPAVIERDYRPLFEGRSRSADNSRGEVNRVHASHLPWTAPRTEPELSEARE